MAGENRHNFDITQDDDNLRMLREYKAELEKLYSKEEFSMISNDDCDKNAIVTSVMLQKSTSIEMYCGKMSVFREAFYQHISSKKGNKSASYAKEEMQKSLETFIKKDDSLMKIYVENYSTDILSDLLPDFKKGIAIGKIRIFSVDKYMILASGIDHIAYADNGNMTRLETDRESHSANCCFHLDSQLSQTASDIFDSLRRASKEPDFKF